MKKSTKIKPYRQAPNKKGLLIPVVCLAVVVALFSLIGSLGSGKGEIGKAAPSVPLKSREDINQIPAPDIYWETDGSFEKKDFYQIYHFTFDADPTELVEDYLSALNRYGLVELERLNDHTRSLVMESDNSLWMELMCAEGSKAGAWTVNVSFSNGFEPTALEIRGKSAENHMLAGGVPQPTKPPVVAVSGPVLPDPGLFLGCERGEDHFSDACSSYLISYDYTASGADLEVIEELVDLLTNGQYDLEQADYQVEDLGRLVCHKYAFNYTGPESVGRYEFYDDPTGNVYMLVNYYPEQDRIGLAFYYGEGFTLIDSGATTSYALTDLNGTIDPDNPFPRTQCNTCHGSGRCNNCGGDGRVNVWRGKGYVDEDCTYCLTGDCPNANCLNGYT